MRNLRRVGVQLILAILAVLVVAPSAASAIGMGDVQPWSATNALPDTVQLSGSATYNGYIYSVGGIDNASTMLDVYYAKLGTDGTIETWTATSALTPQLLDVNVEVSNGYIYAIGGATGATNGTNVSTVYYAKINSDGTLGSWTRTSSLLAATSRAAAVVSNGYMYEMGGVDNSNTKLAEIEHAKINSDGTLGSWTYTLVSLPSATAFLTAEAHDSYIYELGGSTNSGTVATAGYIKVSNDGELNPSGWTTTTALPILTTRASSVVNNGYLYEIGGLNGNSTSLSNVSYARINNDGSLGTWTVTANLPASAYNATATTYNNYMYVLGGIQGNGAYAAYYTQLNVSSPSNKPTGSSVVGYNASADFNTFIPKAHISNI